MVWFSAACPQCLHPPGGTRGTFTALLFGGARPISVLGNPLCM